ncbi:hypothetical protein Esti_004188 [Eimeria stiedai]
MLPQPAEQQLLGASAAASTEAPAEAAAAGGRGGGGRVKRGPRVLVTVGTTAFDSLIRAATSPAFFSCLSSIDCSSLTVQIGRGAFVPFGISAKDKGLASDSGVSVQLSGFGSVRVLRFIDCLSSQLLSFDLVISHGGAGSLLESLRAGLRLVACANSNLLNNHQTELTKHLSANNHCVCLIDLEDLPKKTLEAWRRPLASLPPAAAAAAGSGAQEATQQQQRQQQQQEQQQQQQEKGGKPLVPLPAANREIFFQIIWEEVGSPLGSGVRSLLFAGEGRLLLSGDNRGKACLFDLGTRRPLALLSPAEAACVAASPIGLPFGAGSLPFSHSSTSSSSPVLQLQELWGSRSSSRVVLQQKDSRLSVFDLPSEKFAGCLMTGAVSFCKCACPTNSSSSSVLGSDCVAAPTAELEVAGVFDLRMPSKARRLAWAASPALSLRLSPKGDTSNADKLGSVQALAFPVASAAAAAGSPLLAAAYELPSLALWDLRRPHKPLLLSKLQGAQSPPCELAAPGHRLWVGCIEGEVHLSRISKKHHSTSSSGSSNTSSSSSEAKDSDGTDFSSSNNSSSGDGDGFAAALLPVTRVDVFKRNSEFGDISSEAGGGGAQALLPVSCSEAFVDFEALGGDRLHLTTMAVRADSLLGACGGSDGIVRLHEGKRLRPLGKLEGHMTAVSSAAWCKDTGLLASGDKEGVVLLWDVHRDSFHIHK